MTAPEHTEIEPRKTTPHMRKITEGRIENLLRIIRDHAEFEVVDSLGVVVGRVSAPRLRAELNRYDGPTSDAASVLSDLHAPLASLYQRYGLSFKVREDGLCLVFFQSSDYSRFMGDAHLLPVKIVVVEPKHNARTPAPAPIVGIKPDDVIEAVLSTLAVSYHETITVKSNRGRLMEKLARTVAAYLLRKMCGMSYPQIAKALEYKNHSRPLSLVRTAEEMLSSAKAHGMPDGSNITFRQIVRLAENEARDISAAGVAA